MIASLAPLFSGPLAAYETNLQLASGTDQGIAGSQLFQPEYFAEFMASLAASRGTDDLLALTSIWSKWYFCFLAPAVAASLLLQRELPIALSDVGVALSAEGKPLGLRLLHDGHSLPPCSPFERFSSLIQGHLEPVIEVMASVSKASPRLFWSNAGNLFESATTQVELHPLATVDCATPARAVLESRQRPDGRRNPLFAPVYYKDVGASEPQRLRRICCIRYRLPGVDYCSSCPIDRDKRLE
ncbi:MULTISPECIES: siderophore-iron reductase FhuF [unclassified Pseudomonas]|uniref:siderophore-iron reductase FhuF n=1 Tax=unclassified Pseudomonas TaxID=196821 RepID=UPI0004B7B84F|nr:MULTISPECIES: siderophore-iron reductase FhuF [unclassified Pseudomonas]PZW70044.1 ferric iron reductase protein FhuF [Pseudomonas sp. URMO17WK12:I1]